MAEDKMMRLSQVARILNVGITTIVEHLSANGTKVESNPNTKINSANIEFLSKEFNSADLRSFLATSREEAPAKPNAEEDKRDHHKSDFDEILYFRTPHSGGGKPTDVPNEVQQTPEDEKEDASRVEAVRLPGITVVGKVELDKKGNVVEPFKKEAPKSEAPVASSQTEAVRVPEEAPAKEEAAPVTRVDESRQEEPVVREPVAEERVVADPPAEVVHTPAIADKKDIVEEKPTVSTDIPEVKEVVAPLEEPGGGKSGQAESSASPAEASVVLEDKESAGDQLIEAKGEQLKGLTVVGRIELPVDRGRKKEGGDTARDNDKSKKRKRKRIRGEVKVEGAPAVAAHQNAPKAAPGAAPAKAKDGNKGAGPGQNKPDASKGSSFKRRDRKEQVSEKEVSENIKATMARLGGGAGARGGKGKNRRRERLENEDFRAGDSEETKILRVTEFISANDLATLMEASVQEVISVCMNMGMFVSINQRLDAEAITFIADEFGYEVAFISAEEEVQNEILEEEDKEEDLVERAPIVTIMGHVDHGKTSLLDYIRKANVAGGEAGGITQHIGAYSVKTKTGKQVTFLDTPGHEAFTAMRARGAKVTDVVIIVIAADDSVMPQTREAINHAQVAGVPIVFAFSKVDKPGANAEKVREELAQMNLLVEEWGGKYQTQEISSKSGMGIDELLEKVLLEAELLELKANPKKRALGTVIEASLDKGRGYMATLLVETGTMKVGDFILAGAHFGRVKAMTDYRGNRLKEAGPSMPVLLLGLNGAPQAGDKFNVMENERDAREIANKREQIQREQTMRTRKHITLEEIGRRKAIGSFRELNLIVKGDVDGSVEALSDSLLQLSTAEVQVNIIHKAVGQISESDVNLAIASDAIIVGFQVRPSSNAKKMAEQEQIEIRHYSVIYSAIEEIKDAMTGMLAPTVEEVVTGNIEIRETFKISRIGTIAGCYVLDGFVKRNNKIRIIRDGIVVHTGEIDSLKRFKDDVNEVRSGYEFGLSVKGFNDIEVGDIIESFEFKEVKRTL